MLQENEHFWIIWHRRGKLYFGNDSTILMSYFWISCAYSLNILYNCLFLNIHPIYRRYNFTDFDKSMNKKVAYLWPVQQNWGWEVTSLAMLIHYIDYKNMNT